MWNQAQDAYVETRVLAADPLELVRVLYQAAISSVRDARRFLADGKIAERSRAISKACEIVLELNAALDPSRGGELVARLAALYDYMLRRLLEANQQQSDAPLADVLGLLATLGEAWEAIHPPAEPAGGVESGWPVPPEPASAYTSQTWNL